MHISRITIKNYRGIRNQSLKFSKFNALIGKNDCGKSTVINAIKLFFDDSKATPKDFNYYQSDDKNIEIEIELSGYEKSDFKPFLIKGDKKTGFDEVADDYISDGTLIIKKVWVHKENVDVAAKSSIKVSTFTNSHIHTDKRLVTAGIRTHEVEIPAEGTGKNSDLEKLHYLRLAMDEMSCERSDIWQDVKWTEIKNCVPTVELFRADQSIETTTTEFKSTFSSEIKSIIADERDKDEGSTLSGIEAIIKQKIIEESVAIRNCMSEHISDLEELFIRPNFSWEKGVEITNVEIKLSGDEQSIPLENKGSGYRRLFMVGRLRYLADKKHLRNVIYLVEEPETFLHPSAQEEMRNSLLSLSASNQVLITTHSPIFLGATDDNAITLCKKEETVLLYEQRNDEEFLIDIARQIGVKPSHNILDTYETIIFVEGSNDIKFLKTASEKLGKNLHNMIDNSQIVVFDGGGKSLNNFIDIKYFETLEKNMFLIIDSDIYNVDQIGVNPGLDLQQENNASLKVKFETKAKARAFILNKKNIENYYHPEAVKRLYELDEVYEGLFPDNFCVPTFLKQLKSSNPTKNIQKKNNIALYNEMTSEEWVAVSNNEFQTIFDVIENASVEDVVPS